MNEENDPTRQIERFKLEIKEKGLIHQCLLEYLGISSGQTNPKTKKEEKSENLFFVLKEKSVLTNKCKFREFLETVSHLCKIHHQNKEIKDKIKTLLVILEKDIKNIFSEEEVFHIFYFNKNKFLLLILVEQNILSIEKIVSSIKNMNNNDWSIIKYFYPEIRKYDGKYFKELMIKNQEIHGFKEFVEENDQNLGLFNEIRKVGEKEPKIMKLIREDKIDEFISFVEHSPINLNEKIQKEGTIFETNPKNLTPIEYSALFGSIEIFKYLSMKEVDINFIVDNEDNNNIIEYAIQGRNYQIIHLLEEEEIKKELSNQENLQKYLKVSIKMHYNEIYEYFMTNFANNQVTGKIITQIIKYRNYQLFDQLVERNEIELKNIGIITTIFHRICKNGNEEIVKILINQPNLDINLQDIIFQHSIESNSIEKGTTS